MAGFAQTRSLTHAGTMAILSAAIARAEAIGQPHRIVLVDASGEVLGEVRMTGARFSSRNSALAMALTAASTGPPSSDNQIRIFGVVLAFL